MTEQGPRTLIAGWLDPSARLLQRHELLVAAPQDRTYEAVQEVRLREMPVSRTLFTLRRIPYAKDTTLRRFFSTPPFLILQEDPPREIVFGVAGRSWRMRDGGADALHPTTPAEFRACTSEGTVRAIANFRVDAAKDGVRLSTETWVETFGVGASRLFAAYWVVIGPFSALIRREFLRAARSAAERRH